MDTMVKSLGGQGLCGSLLPTVVSQKETLGWVLGLS